MSESLVFCSLQCSVQEVVSPPARKRSQEEAVPPGAVQAKAGLRTLLVRVSLLGSRCQNTASSHFALPI